MSEMFDRLAKLAAGGVSRREALHYVGGFLAGGFLAALPGRARAASDPCPAYCAKCPAKPTEVQKHCMEHCERFVARNPSGTLCGTCTAEKPFTGCPAGATCCTAASGAVYCVNLNTNRHNCGACGTKCKEPTSTCCSGKCVDLSSDTNNCHRCGRKCTTGTTPACCHSRCVDLSSDKHHCGACGTHCEKPTSTCCSGKCVDLSSDNNNCGSCGNKCASGKTCTKGVCS